MVLNKRCLTKFVLYADMQLSSLISVPTAQPNAITKIRTVFEQVSQKTPQKTYDTGPNTQSHSRHIPLVELVAARGWSGA